MSKEPEELIVLHPTFKYNKNFPKGKRCCICKKKAHSRLRIRDLEKWKYYCNRCVKKQMKLHLQQSHNNLNLAMEE